MNLFPTFIFKGHSVDPERQQEPHALHDCVSGKQISAGERFRNDRIMVFHFDPKTAKLTPESTVLQRNARFRAAQSGISSKRKWAYSIDEMGCILECMNWNGAGALTRFQVISSLPKDHK